MLRTVTRTGLALSTLVIALGCAGFEIPGMPGDDIELGDDATDDDVADEADDEADEAEDDDDDAKEDTAAEDGAGGLPEAFEGWPVPLEGAEIASQTKTSVTFAHTGDPIEMAKRYTRELKQAAGWMPADRNPQQRFATLKNGEDSVKLSWTVPKADGTFELTLELQ